MTQLRTLDASGTIRGVGLDDLRAGYGTYVPGPSSTGSRWVGAYTRMSPSNPDGPINITTPGTYEGIEFWGRVVVQVLGVIFRNCMFRGADPAAVSQGRACIQSSGANPPYWEGYDCTIDPSGWANFGTAQSGRGNCFINGISGSNYQIERWDIKNVNDGIQFVGPIGSLEIAQASRTRVWGCDIHKGYWMAPFGLDVGGFADNQPHSDAFQLMTGKNLDVWGCKIGGIRVPAGYVIPGGSNLGDDFGNAGFMMTQEVGADEMRKLENIDIRHNFLAGAVATFNWAYQSARPNQWETTVVRHNKLALRGANWGPPSNPSSGGIYGNLTQSLFLGEAYDNTIWETGAPAPGMNK